MASSKAADPKPAPYPMPATVASRLVYARRMRVVVAVLVLVLATSSAHAQSYFEETHYDIGIASLSGVSFGGASASGTAFHITEHNGLVSRMILAIPFFLAGIQVGGDQKMAGGITHGTEDYDVVEVDSHGVERSRETRTRETTSFNFSVVERTPEEKVGQARTREALSQEYALIAVHPMHFELRYLPERDDGHVHGIDAAIYPIAIGIGRHLEIAAGVSGSRMKIDVSEPDGMRTALHRSHAIPVRIGIAATRWLVLTAELHNNFLSAYGSTFRGTAAISLPHVERFYAKVGGERIGLANGVWSTFVEGGMRF